MEIQELEEYFKADLAASKSSLEEFKEALEYYHSDQLPADVLSVIQSRGQVPLHENMFKMIVNKIIVTYAYFSVFHILFELNDT